MADTAKTYIILQLSAPLAAFGGEAIDNYGVTRSFPAKSMLTGLIANALGYQRQEFHKLASLQQKLSFAARLDQPADGTTLRDFQTATIGKADAHWTTHGVPATRAGGPDTYSGPHLRYRDYVEDLVAYIAFTLTDNKMAEKKKPNIDEIVEALRHPSRPLFIGRKSCLPSKPLYLRTQHADSALSALLTIPAIDHQAVSCQWMDYEGLPTLEGITESWICDERDWQNSQHTGTRKLHEASVPSELFLST